MSVINQVKVKVTADATAELHRALQVLQGRGGGFSHRDLSYLFIKSSLYKRKAAPPQPHKLFLLCFVTVTLVLSPDWNISSQWNTHNNKAKGKEQHFVFLQCLM